MDAYEDSDGNGIGYTPDYSMYGELPKVEAEKAVPFHVVIFFTQLVVILPIVFILNLILFIKIVRTEKTKKDPWRWLVANYSFCLVVKVFCRYNEIISYDLKEPSLLSTIILCPSIVFLSQIVWCMSSVTSTLIVTERFHALRHSKESEGGFNKKAVVICLAFFWIILTLGLIIPAVLVPLSRGHPPFFYGKHCHSEYPELLPFIQVLIVLWATPTCFVVLIGALVLRCKASSDAGNMSTINLTLALSSIGLFFMVAPLALHACYFILPSTAFGAGYTLYPLVSLAASVYDIAFPIIWLVTWSINGDISLTCGKGEREQQGLLEDQNMVKLNTN